MKSLTCGWLVGFFVCSLASPLRAQDANPPDSKSSSVVKQLVAALDAAKLDCIAAKDPARPDTFVAALYFQGSQLLVVSAKYSAPALLVDKLAKKDYRDVYLDLNGAAMPGTKVFVEDPGANGLRPQRVENQPFDSVEVEGKRTVFDGDWKKQNLSEEEYTKAFASADERYSQMLTALLAQLK